MNKNSLIKNLQRIFLLPFLLTIYSQEAYSLARLFTFNPNVSYTLLSLKIRDSEGNDFSDDQTDLSNVYDGLGYGLNMSFDIWRWLSLEIGYNSMGNSSISSQHPSRTSGKVNFHGTNFVFIYSYPQIDYGLQFHGKMGFFALATDTNLNYVTQTNDTGLTMGGSISYFTRDGWGGQFNLFIHSQNLQIFSAGMSRRFDITTKETTLSQQNTDVELTKNLQSVLTSTKETYNSFNQNTGESVRGGSFFELFAKSSNTGKLTRDEDNDGVPDGLDKCPSSPASVNVDINGCLISSVDSTDNNIISNTRLYPDDSFVEENDDVIKDFYRSTAIKLSTISPISNSELRSLQEAGISRRLEGLDIEDLLGVRTVESQIEAETEEEIASAEELLNLSEKAKISDLASAIIDTSRGILDINQFNELQTVKVEPFQTFNPTNNTSPNQNTITEGDPIQRNFESSVANLKKEISNQINQGNDTVNLNNQNATNLNQLNDEIKGELNFDTLNQPIIFLQGRSNLTGTQRQQLNNIASLLRKNRRSRLEINVWSDPNVINGENIAQRQAKRVINYLVENGVNRKQLTNSADFIDIQANTQLANQVTFNLVN